MIVTGDNLMSGKNDDDNISPYLRRPLRSLADYLKEAARLRNRVQRESGKSDRSRPVAEDGRHGEEE